MRDGDDEGTGRPRDAPEREPAGGRGQPPGSDPGDISREQHPDPHHSLNNPVGEPDPTEWPDPYERRPDPRFPEQAPLAGAAEDEHTPGGALSTSEPHPDQDIEAPYTEAPKRERLDE